MYTQLKIIDFQDFINAGYNKFETRSCGIILRKLSSLDQTMDKEQRLLIKMPPHLHSINTTFIEEFLATFSRQLSSADDFENRVEFENTNVSIKQAFSNTVNKILERRYSYA